MPTLTRDMARQTLERLEPLKPDSKPKWGEFTGEDLVPHLIGTFQYSMGHLERELRDVSNWVTTRVLPLLLFSGILKFPRNVKLKDSKGRVVPAISAPGDLTTLKEVMEEFLSGAASDRFELGRHPVFGDLGPKGWARFHAAHIAHHLRQFGL